MNSFNFKNLPLRWYGLAVAIIVLDQITKVWASSAFNLGEVDAIFPGFNLTLRHNYGMAFSIFADGDGWQRWFLGIVAAGVSIGIAIWMAKLDKNSRLELIGFALILGGAIGNLYDRVLLGYVVDFIEVYYDKYYWPAFNIADSAITVGAGCLIYDAVFCTKKPKVEQA